jgi:hypothetical protein
MVSSRAARLAFPAGSGGRLEPDRRWQAALLGYFAVLLLLLSLPVALSGPVGPLAVSTLMLPPDPEHRGPTASPRSTCGPIRMAA